MVYSQSTWMETLQQQGICWVLFPMGWGKEIVLFTRTIRLSSRGLAVGMHLEGPRLNPKLLMAVLGWYIFNGYHSLDYPKPDARATEMVRPQFTTSQRTHIAFQNKLPLKGSTEMGSTRKSQLVLTRGVSPLSLRLSL